MKQMQALTSYQRSTAAVNEMWQAARQSSLMVKGAQLAPRPASNTVTKEGGVVGSGGTFLQNTGRLTSSVGAVQQCKIISYWAPITITEALGLSGTSTLVRGRQELAAFQVRPCKPTLLYCIAHLHSTTCSNLDGECYIAQNPAATCTVLHVYRSQAAVRLVQ